MDYSLFMQHSLIWFSNNLPWKSSLSSWELLFVLALNIIDDADDNSGTKKQILMQRGYVPEWACASWILESFGSQQKKGYS